MSTVLMLISRLPLSIQYGLGYVLYLLLYRLLRVRRHIVFGNLCKAFPHLDQSDINQVARGFYRNYADVVMEMVKSITMDRQDLGDRVRFDNLDMIEEELARGQPVLLTVAHHCNIEWLLLALCCRLNYPMEAIYRPVANASVERIMTTAYTRFGGVLVDDRSVVKEVMARKNVPRVVAIASDQAPNINDQKVWVDFLHQETAFFLAPDTIARFVNYPVYFLTMNRLSRGYYEAAFKRIAQPPYVGKEQTILKAYIAAVEKQITDYPEDWLWIHNRWKRQRSVYE